MEEQSALQQVLDLFVEYYGEDRVDSQDSDGMREITIWFPTVRITNEHDRYADLTNLYIRVKLGSDGLLIGTFTMNRSECTAKQWTSDYYHSHLNGIPKSNLSQFRTTCLGSGPIRDTCSTLNRNFDVDLWRLFIHELDLYVHTESLTGGPYRKLEEIGIRRGYSSRERQLPIYSGYSSPIYNDGARSVLRMFISYVIQRKPYYFRYFNGKYSISTTAFEFILSLSNLFIEWYNSLIASEQGSIREDFFSIGILMKCRVSDNKFYIKNTASNQIDRSYQGYIGRTLWMFKGNPVTFNVINDYVAESEEDDEQYDYTIINPEVAMNLKYRIERVINFRYGNRNISTNQEISYI